MRNLKRTWALPLSEAPGWGSTRGVLAARGLLLPLRGGAASSKGSYVTLRTAGNAEHF